MGDARDDKAQQGDYRIFVGGLSFDVNDGSLRDTFSKFGEVCVWGGVFFLAESEHRGKEAPSASAYSRECVGERPFAMLWPELGAALSPYYLVTPFLHPLLWRFPPTRTRLYPLPLYSIPSLPAAPI